MARNAPPQPQHARVIRAGAQQVRRLKDGKVYGLKREKWQDDAWDVYDLVGEIKQGVNFMANVCSLCRIYIGVMPDDDDTDPRPVEPGDVGGAEATDILDRIRRGSVHGGLGGMIHEMVANRKVAGEFIVIAEQERQPDPTSSDVEARMGRPERWNVYSVSEVKEQSGVVQVAEAPGAKPREFKLPMGDEQITDDADYVFMLRVWQRHPRYGLLADCMMRALLSEADELLLLSRAARSTARSRLASRGIVEIPLDYSVPNPNPDEGDESEDPERDPFMARLAEAMMESLEDESSADGVVPIVVRAPADVMAKAGIKHTLFESPIDGKISEERKYLLERIGATMDIPWEQVAGMGDANHWSAWAVDMATWGRYGLPEMRFICEALTEGILWPYLVEAGIDATAARRLVIWFDPADAIVDPDESKTADELFDRGAISWDAYRQRKGATDDETPTDEELAQRSMLGLLRGSGGQPATGGVTTDGESEQTQPQATTAAARPRMSIGRRLAQIDQRLRVQLAEIAEQALTRTLERAGAKIRSKANGNQALRASIADVPAYMVPAHCGPSTVAAVGLTERDLIAANAETFAQRIDGKIRQAQEQARKALRQRFNLDDLELEELETQQERDRSEAVAWFLSALMKLAADRLYNPRPDAPALGEFDSNSSVPADMIRDLMTRAGGGTTPEGMPNGGVATGPDVLAIWNRQGLKLSGWEWVHGDPQRPFDPHEALDGQAFSNLSDPVLAVAPEDSWLGVDFYRPGDHANCTCSIVPLSDDDVAPADTEETADVA